MFFLISVMIAPFYQRDIRSLPLNCCLYGNDFRCLSNAVHVCEKF